MQRDEPPTRSPESVQFLPLSIARAIDSDDARGRSAGSFFADLIAANGTSLRDGDVLVVSSKVAAMFEGGQVRLADVAPSRKARLLGRMLRRDPRKLQLVLEQGRVLVVIPVGRIVRIPAMRRMLEKRSANPDAMFAGFSGLNRYELIVHKHAAYLDEAGIDHTNSPEGHVTIPPEAPCVTARRIREELSARCGADIAVIVTDTTTVVGRLGSQDVAIGYSGIDPVTRQMFSDDLFGTPRSGGMDLVIDSIAGMAGLIMGQTTERRPAVIVRGVEYRPERSDDLPGMAAVEMPGGSMGRIVLRVLLATLWFRLGCLLSLQGRATRPR